MIEPVLATTAMTLTALALVLTLFGISALIVGAVTFSNYISDLKGALQEVRYGEQTQHSDFENAVYRRSQWGSNSSLPQQRTATELST